MSEPSSSASSVRMETRSGKVLRASIISGRPRGNEGNGVPNLLREDPWTKDSILDNVFKYCTPTMIDNCRLVSKKWYTASLPVWKTHSGSRPIQIECKRNPGRGRDGWRKEPGPGYMSDFVLDFHIYAHLSPQINGMAKYSNFALNLDGTSLSSPEIRLEEFWVRNGAWITSLKIFYSGPPDLDFLRRIFNCNDTPVLQGLDLAIQLEDCRDADQVKELLRDQRRGAAPLFDVGGGDTGLKSLKIAGVMTHILVDWKVVLGSCCPKLENLDLSECDWEWENNLEEILRAIKGIREEEPTKLCLKSFSWGHIGMDKRGYKRHHTRTVSTLLQELQLPDLESLSFSFGEGRCLSDRKVHKLCTMHANSLQKLSFLHPVPLGASPFVGLTMAHLGSLVVDGRAFDNLLFLKELPVLRSLQLKLCNNEQITRADREFTIGLERSRSTIISATGDKEMGGVTIHSLTSFSCDYWGNFEADDLSRLHRWMPALTRLEVRLSNESLPALCQLWPSLQHVTIFGGRIGDKGIVGLEKRANGKISFNKPNITNLQDLRSFVVMPRRFNNQGQAEGSGEKLSLHSVKQGLSKLPRLEQVTLDKVMILDGPEKTEECMKKEMPLVKINWL